MKKAMLVLWVSSFAFLGCGAEVRDGEFRQHENPIINGQPATGGFYDAVVSLHKVASGYVYRDIFCSGTLITSDVVLTAAHCLDVGQRKVTTMAPSAVAVYVGNGPKTDPAPRFYAAVETVIHPGYDKRAITNDLALIRLSVPVAGVTPIPPLPASLGFTTADEGRLALNFAGFGKTETGTYNEKLEFSGVLSRIYSPTQIYYTQAEGGPCSGDSGGPAFVNRNGVNYLGGLTSYGDAYCTQYGVSTRVDAFESFIAAFVGGASPAPDCSADGACNAACAAGTDPDCAPTPPAGGTCGDAICSAGETTASCHADCVITHPKRGEIAWCGDGVCHSRETVTQCAADCL